MLSLKHLLFVFLFASLLTACSSSQKTLDELHPDLIEVNPPNRIPYIEKDIEIEGVEFMEIQRNPALLIKGRLPNMCTQILRVDQKTPPEIIELTIIGWQQYKKPCEQSGSPSFTYIHKNLDAQLWKNTKLVIINNQEHKTSDLLKN